MPVPPWHMGGGPGFLFEWATQAGGFAVKLVYIGNKDALAKAFIDKAGKEGHDVYFLSETDFSGGDLPTQLKYRYYRLCKKPDLLDKVFDSILPQVVVFAGDMPLRYECHWSEGYLQQLSRVLAQAVRVRAQRFVYLSSQEVYGQGESPFRESDALEPTSEKGLLMAQAEYMVDQFAKFYHMEVSVLRAAQLYSENCAEDAPDFLSHYIRELRSGAGVQVNGAEVLQPLHVEDMAEAIKRVADLPQGGVYNVCGSFAVPAAELCEKLKAHFGLHTAVSIRPGAPGTLASSDLLKKQTEWVDLKRLDAFLEEGALHYRQAPARQEHKGKGLPAGLRRTLENLVLFALFFAAYRWTGDHSLFSQVDWLLVYVTVISLFFGLRQSALSVFLAVGAYLWGQGLSILEMTNFYSYAEGILRIVSFIFFGIVISYTVDTLRDELRDTRRGRDMLQDDFDKLQEINRQNVLIKSEYEKRLLDSRQSIPQLYTLIERLMVLSPDRIFMELLQVIAQLTDTDTVAVYAVSPQSSYLRLIAALSEESAVSGKSWNIAPNSQLRAAVERGELYRGDVWQGEPSVVLPVRCQSRTTAVIVVRKLRYTSCTLYHMNLLKTVGLLASEAVARAMDYEKLTAATRFLGDTVILNPEPFREAVRLAAEKKDKGLADSCVLRLDVQGTPQSVDEKLGAFFRTVDQLGTDGKGGYYVLLNNTGAQDVQTVQARLLEKGVGSQVEDLLAVAGV